MRESRKAQRLIFECTQARALLADARVHVQDVRGCRGRLTRFLAPYLPLFYRREQRDNAVIVVQGLLSGLERKTAEPIAAAHGVQRKPIQFFVGTGKWDDEAVMGHLRRHVVAVMGDDQAVLVLDASTFPKKGKCSCGVGRAWCGRLGKVENCQTGMFLAYATDRGQAPLDRRLHLPQDWAQDPARRDQTHVPPEVKFAERWRTGLAMIDAHRGSVPHGWIAADDEFGRVGEFRAALRDRGESYVLDVPGMTRIGDLDAPPPSGKNSNGRARTLPFVRMDQWAVAQPAARWKKIQVKDGEKGPIVVWAMTARVCAKLKGRNGPPERMVIRREQEGENSKLSYHLSWTPQEQVPLDTLVKVRGRRHQVEELFQHGKGEAGLDHYEVRSWVGWHHHMTLSLLALWFLCLERLTTGKKNTGDHGAAGSPDRVQIAAPACPDRGADRRRNHECSAAQRGVADLPLARTHATLSTAATCA